MNIHLANNDKFDRLIKDIKYSDDVSKHTSENRQQIVDFYDSIKDKLPQEYAKHITYSIIKNIKLITTYGSFFEAFNYKIFLKSAYDYRTQKAINLLYKFREHNLMQYIKVETEELENTLFEDVRNSKLSNAEQMKILNNKDKLIEFFTNNFNIVGFMNAIANIDEMRLFKQINKNDYQLNQNFLLFQPMQNYIKITKDEPDSFEEIMRNTTSEHEKLMQLAPMATEGSCPRCENIDQLCADCEAYTKYIKQHMQSIQDKYRNTVFQDKNFIQAFELCLWTTILTSINIEFSLQYINCLSRGLDLQAMDADLYITCAFDTRLAWFKQMHYIYQHKIDITNELIYQSKFTLPSPSLDAYGVTPNAYNHPPKCELFDILSGFVRKQWVMGSLNYTSVFDEFTIKKTKSVNKDLMYGIIIIILIAIICYLFYVILSCKEQQITNQPTSKHTDQKTQMDKTQSKVDAVEIENKMSIDQSTEIKKKIPSNKVTEIDDTKSEEN